MTTRHFGGPDRRMPRNRPAEWRRKFPRARKPGKFPPALGTGEMKVPPTRNGESAPAAAPHNTDRRKTDERAARRCMRGAHPAIENGRKRR